MRKKRNGMIRGYLEVLDNMRPGYVTRSIELRGGVGTGSGWRGGSLLHEDIAAHMVLFFIFLARRADNAPVVWLLLNSSLSNPCPAQGQ